MNTNPETSLYFDCNNEAGNDRLSYDLIVYVFGYMPSPGGTVSLDQIAEDLEETPDTILAAIEELRLDGLLEVTYVNGTITVVARDERFLQEQMAYDSIRR